MPKLKLNHLLHSFSGRVGNLIIYEADGQILARTAPEAHAERSPKQEERSARFKAAGAYATAATADPAVKAWYQRTCHGHQNARNLAIRDYMSPPVIDELDAAAYSGGPGQIIRVQANDDCGVTQVIVSLLKPDGTLVEEGVAENTSGQGEWQYRTEEAVAAGSMLLIKAVAADRAGNRTEGQIWHYLSPD